VSTDQDNEMWQRIEDAFTPNVAELRRAEKDLSRVRPQSFKITKTNAIDAEKGQSTQLGKRRNARLFALAAMMFVLVGGIAWIGRDIITAQHFNDLTDPDKAVFALAAPTTPKIWELSMTYATGRIRTGLRGIQHLANSHHESALVREAATKAWRRILEGRAHSAGDGSHDIGKMCVTAIHKDTPVTDKLTMINNMEHMTGMLVQAVRTAQPLVPRTCELMKWKIDHWLIDAATRSPTWTDAETVPAPGQKPGS
jgi:hypothetical protein